MIDPLAIVSDEATIGKDVCIGPYSIVDSGAILGDSVIVGSYSTISRNVSIGAKTQIGHHSLIGSKPQIRGHKSDGTLIIGEANTIGDYVSISFGSEASQTRIGNENYLMAYVHIGHDSKLGSHNELANAVQCAGHCQIGDFCTIGGMSALHQFVRVGSYAMLAGGSMLSMDVLPFCLAAGNRARIVGLNRLGLKRRNFSAQDRNDIKGAILSLLKNGVTEKRLDMMKRRETTFYLLLRDFITQQSVRGYSRMKMMRETVKR